jgi:predicted permease
VIGEVAITVALVLIGGKLLGSFLNLLGTDPGFQAGRILASVVLPQPERYTTPQQRATAYGRFLEAVRAIPGVKSAGTVDALPFSGENHGGFISTNSADTLNPNNRFIAEIDVIGGDYLQTLGVRLIAGRWFRDEEMNESSGAAIINDIAANRLWPATSAIGKQICINCTAENPSNWKRVVGVVSSVRHSSLDTSPGYNVYLAAGALEHASFLVIRTDQPIRGLDKAVQRAIAAIDPGQPVLFSASIQSLIDDSIGDRRFITSLLTATGCLALLMSIAGIYGVTSYTTSCRTQEIGIRMAFGATPASVHALMFRDGFLVVVLGMAVGLALTSALMRALNGVVVGLETGSMADFWIAASLVALTAAAACWIPSRRVTRIGPMDALRHD